MARIVICGYMVRHPVAGNLMAYFHYVLGFARLGHSVVYLEESGWPAACYDPATGTYSDDPTAGLRAVRRLLTQSSLELPVYYVDRATGTVTGGTPAAVQAALEGADLLLNVGGVCWMPAFARCRRRALVDMDPVFTQLGQFGGSHLADHEVLFSYGTNLGQAGCTAPTAGFTWHATVPPVVPELWPAVPAPPDGPFTTIANWQAYGAAQHGGMHYGQKDEEFLRMRELPAMVPQRLELALSGADAGTVAALRVAGWSVRDGATVSSDLAAYRGYIAGSRGEFSVAKHAYVSTRSGWFSDRTVCYLAAGRPAVLQDTGFDAWLPTGHGVLAIATPAEAATALRQVDEDYARHSQAAREIAREVFDYRVVLPRLLAVALDGRALARTPAGGGAA
ncbi:MAG TPA: hypothetical protein VM536_16870 [Chloroflexia bacterium]|nr:hypothetical protein [Chloroflexia bacterium]